jgi:hypothetical protein
MAMNRMPRILSFDWSRCRQVKLYHVLRREKLGCCDDLLFIYQQCSADDETNQSAAAISNDQDGETTKKQVMFQEKERLPKYQAHCRDLYIALACAQSEPFDQ